MTVFCALYSDLEQGEDPIVISDVLITGGVRHSPDGERYRRTYIPSLGGTFPQVSSDFAIVGLGQKTYLTESGNCFSVAGDLDLVKALHAQLSAGNGVLHALTTCAPLKDADVQFAVFIADDAGAPLNLLHSATCNVFRPGSYGRVVIGGSGENTLRKLVLRQQDTTKLTGDNAIAPIARALCLINEALDWDESDPSETLGEKFGAYYEIAVYHNERFIKMGNIAHHFLTFKSEGDGGYWMYRKSYYHEYVGNDLVVRRITVGHDDNQSVAWQDCYVIGGLNAPVDETTARAHITGSAPTPAWEVLCLEVHGAVFRVVSSQRHLLNIRMSEGKWYFSVDEDLGKELAEEIIAKI